MAEYILERRKLSGSEISQDIARHIQARQTVGRALVITGRPSILLSAMRRQWMMIIQALQRECARTLDSALRAELLHQQALMRELSFVSKPPTQLPDADVYFLSPEVIGELPGQCSTIYVYLEAAKRQAVLKALQPKKGAVVVEYYTEGD